MERTRSEETPPPQRLDLSPEDGAASPSGDRKSLARGVFTNTLGVAARTSRPLFLIIFSRFLGAEGFGLYLLGYAIQEVVGKAGVLGLNWGSMKVVGDLKGQGHLNSVRKVVGTILALGLISSTLTALFLAGFAPWIAESVIQKPELGRPLSLFALTIPCVSGTFILLDSIRPSLDMRYEVVVRQLIEPLSVLLLGILALSQGWGVMGLAGAHVATSVLTFGLALFCFRRVYPRAEGEKVKVPWRKLYHSSIGMGGMEFLNQFKFRLDLMVIARFMPLAFVGAYGAVVEICGILRKVRSAFLPILMPLTQGLHLGGEKKRFEEQLGTALRWSMIPTLALTGTIILLPTAYLKVFGDDFVVATFALVILAVGHLFYVNLGLLEAVLAIIGRFYMTLANLVIAFSINLLVLLWLVPKWGLLAAAWSTAATFLGISIVLYLQTKRFLGVEPFDRRQLKSIGAFLGALLVGFGMGRLLEADSYLEWTAQGVTFLLAYAIILFIFRAEVKETNLFRWGRAVGRRFGGLNGSRKEEIKR